MQSWSGMIVSISKGSKNYSTSASFRPYSTLRNMNVLVLMDLYAKYICKQPEKANCTMNSLEYHWWSKILAVVPKISMEKRMGW